ncbi:LysR family transcriptional regulator [Vibrio chagasii]|uniref:LysR family transcriptional regulator n=1 Tax=Vibrio chagasii TaxID=170679 RepID=UPI0037356472
MHRSNNNFDLNTLTIFRRVVELNSLSKTAEELVINPSTVSRKISDLESFYGVKLLLRTTRTLTLTEEGKAFYGYCQSIEDLLVRSENEITNTQVEPTGLLRLVIPVDTGNLAMSDALNEFAIKYPKVVLDLEFSNRTVDVVEEGVDVWFCVGEAPNQSLISKRVMTHRRYLMASKEYLSKYGNIESIDDIAPPHRQVLNKNPFNYKNKNAIKHLPYSIAVNSSYAVLKSCLAGLGVAYVAQSLVNKYDTENQLVTILGEELWSEAVINMVYPERKLKPMRTEYFLDFMSNYFRYI